MNWSCFLLRLISRTFLVASVMHTLRLERRAFLRFMVFMRLATLLPLPFIMSTLQIWRTDVIGSHPATVRSTARRSITKVDWLWYWLTASKVLSQNTLLIWTRWYLVFIRCHRFKYRSSGFICEICLGGEVIIWSGFTRTKGIVRGFIFGCIQTSHRVHQRWNHHWHTELL